MVHAVEVTAADPRVTLRLPPFGILDRDQRLRGALRAARRCWSAAARSGRLPLRDVKVEAGAIELAVVWPDGTRYQESLTLPAGGVLRRIVRPSPAPPSP